MQKYEQQIIMEEYALAEFFTMEKHIPQPYCASIVEEAEEIIENYIKTKVEKVYKNLVPKKKRRSRDEEMPQNTKKVVANIIGVLSSIVIATIITAIIIGIVI